MDEGGRGRAGEGGGGGGAAHQPRRRASRPLQSAWPRPRCRPPPRASRRAGAECSCRSGPGPGGVGAGGQCWAQVDAQPATQPPSARLRRCGGACAPSPPPPARAATTCGWLITRLRSPLFTPGSASRQWLTGTPTWQGRWGSGGAAAAAAAASSAPLRRRRPTAPPRHLRSARPPACCAPPPPPQKARLPHNVQLVAQHEVVHRVDGAAQAVLNRQDSTVRHPLRVRAFGVRVIWRGVSAWGRHTCVSPAPGHAPRIAWTHTHAPTPPSPGPTPGRPPRTGRRAAASCRDRPGSPQSHYTPPARPTGTSCVGGWVGWGLRSNGRVRRARHRGGGGGGGRRRARPLDAICSPGRPLAAPASFPRCWTPAAARRARAAAAAGPESCAAARRGAGRRRQQQQALDTAAPAAARLADAAAA